MRSKWYMNEHHIITAVLSDRFSSGESNGDHSGWRTGKSHAQAEWTGLTGKEKKMGETIIEKIISTNVGKDRKAGDIVTVNVDRVMIHDIFIPFVAEKFEEMGFTNCGIQTKLF